MKIRPQMFDAFIIQPESEIDQLFINSKSLRLCTVLLKYIEFNELDRIFSKKYSRYRVEGYDVCYNILELICESIK